MPGEGLPIRLYHVAASRQRDERLGWGLHALLV